MSAILRAWPGRFAGLAVGLGLWAAAGTASAQNGGAIVPVRAPAPAPAPVAAPAPYAPPVVGCVEAPAPGCAGGCATCGGGGSNFTAGCPHGGCGPGEKLCSMCGRRIYPVFDKRYIRQFCKPTICPGSCFGYFRPQWTPWREACPNWEDETAPTRYATADGTPGGPAAIPPATPSTVAPGTPMPPPAGGTPGTPMPMPKTGTDTTPPPAPTPLTIPPRPKAGGTTTPPPAPGPGSQRGPGLIVPAVPEAPVQWKPAAGVIPSTEPQRPF